MLSTIDDATLIKVAMALGDEEAVRLIEFLKGVEEITDDEIANKTGIRLNYSPQNPLQTLRSFACKPQKNKGSKNRLVYFSLETSTRPAGRIYFKPKTQSS